MVVAAYILLAAWQWTHFVVKSWDLGIFTQLLRRYAGGEAPIVNIKGDGFNLLGDHFHPLLAIFAPVYAAFPHAFTLLVLQALCFGAAAGVFTAVACRRLGTGVGILLGLAFGLSWGLQNAAEAQFHEIALAVPLLTCSCAALLDGRARAAGLWAAPLVFVKEDLGLTVAVVGALVFARGSRRVGVALAGWGLAWFALATLVILPALNSAGAWAYAGNFDPIAVLTDPAALFAAPKFATLGLLLAATAGLILGSPLALLALPTLTWRFLSPNDGYWGPTWHYSAVLMPIAFAALLDGVARCACSRRACMRAWGSHGVAVAVTAAVMLLPQLPLWQLASAAAWEPAPRAAAARDVLAAVPAGASVETDIGLMSYLVDDHDVYWTGNPNPAPDCILIDRRAGGTPASWGGALDVAARLHPDTTYRSRFAADGYELACRP